MFGSRRRVRSAIHDDRDGFAEGRSEKLTVGGSADPAGLQQGVDIRLGLVAVSDGSVIGNDEWCWHAGRGGKLLRAFLGRLRGLSDLDVTRNSRVYQLGIRSPQPCGPSLSSVRVKAALSGLTPPLACLNTAQIEHQSRKTPAKGRLRRARADGKHLGRPAIGLDADRARAVLTEGGSLRKAAAGLGVSTRTLARRLHG